MMYIQNKKIFWETDYVFCLFQVYSFLRAYQNILNLNNLNLQSIMMCSIDTQKDKYHFKYIYKEQNRTIFEFFSPYIVKIIDYSKAYIKNESEYILQDVLRVPKEQQQAIGLSTILNNLKINKQKDLNPLKFLKMYLSKHEKPDDIMDKKFQELLRQVDKQDGIQDIESAYEHLKIYMQQINSNKISGHLYGTFEINTDVIDSINDIKNPKINKQNAFKFTLNY